MLGARVKSTGVFPVVIVVVVAIAAALPLHRTRIGRYLYDNSILRDQLNALIKENRIQ